jgi:uncharacterized protein YjbI with pentapeptide repeats
VTDYPLPDDVQAAATVLGRLPDPPEGSRGDLHHAHLASAKLYNASLSRANLSGAVLSKANLSRADLSGAVLDGVDLSSARLYGVDLRATDLRQEQLDSAHGDRATKLPDRLQRPKTWME